jgi:signal transduction histidine kinase
MSLKAKITLLTTAVAVTMIAGLCFVQLHNVVESWLAGAHDVAELAGQQVKHLLLVRLQEREDAEARAGRNPGLAEMLESDPELPPLLEATMARTHSTVEISIADRTGRVAASSNPLRARKAVPKLSDLRELREMPPFRRLIRLLTADANYEVSIPLGVAGNANPLLTIHVVISPVLLRDDIVPAMLRVARWGAAALVAAFVLTWFSTRMVTSNLTHLSTAIDRISSGESLDEPSRRATAPEFAAIESKLNVLGQQFRGAEKLRDAIETALHGLQESIAVFDSDERLLFAGGSMGTVLGLSPESRGRRREQIFPATSALGAALRDGFRERRAIHEKTFVWAHGGVDRRLTINLEFGPETQPGRATALLRIRDDAAHRQLESQLGASLRADGMSRIMGSIAHEIKNPLNSIAVRLDNLQAWASDDFPDAGEDIQLLLSEVHRLDRAVRTFLDLTRPVELTVEDFDMAALCDEVAALLRPEASRRAVDLHVIATRRPVIVSGDRDMLKEAVINVVSNGMEAMAEGGTLRMRVVSGEGGCVVCISDTGCGIPEAVRTQMFDPYFTTKPEGSGLGLPRTLRALELHGGGVDVDSAAGYGTDIYLRLPSKA